MRSVLAVSVCVFAACVLACGGGKKTSPDQKSPEKESPPVSSIKSAGRIDLGKVCAEYYHPDANRAAVADKYFGKYWEIDLTGEAYGVDEDGLTTAVRYFRTYPVKAYFRDRKDLLKFGIKNNKRVNIMFVGRAVDAQTFDDCFIPGGK